MADEQQFQPGDIVQLKSGGPKMTVRSIQKENGQTVIECSWFPSATAEQSRTDIFYDKMLTKKFS